MDKSAIRNFSIEARKILMKSAETEAGFYGVTRKGCKSSIQKGNDFEVYETLAGTENRIYGADIKKRSNLVEAVETLGFDQVIEETAYTWFNRIIAIRFMEVNGYLPTRVRVLSSETGSNTPDIVTQSLDVDLNMTPEELEKVQKAKDENRYDDAFRMLFVKQCNELNAILPGLFEKTDDYMELLLKLSYTSDGVVRMLVDTVAEDNFNVETEGQVEIIGWMYQYYNTELKDDTFAKLKKNVKITKERIPAATQLFTPDWIVRYMVENSVGRVWIEHLRAMDSSIDEKAKAEEFGWKYYLSEEEQEEEVKQKLVEIRKSYLKLTPKDITCIDPCMGSGHILVYMFDVLIDIYRSEGFSERDAAFSILENNIRGLDIDKRAYQLSYFALMMKARGMNRTFFRGLQDENGERRFVEPVVFAIEDSNDINREQLNYFGVNLSEIDKNNALIKITSLLDSLYDAKEYGSILGIDDNDWDLIEKFTDTESTVGQISFTTLGIENTKRKLHRLIKQGKTMADEYWVVSTNPPYMGSNGMGIKLGDYVKMNYPASKADLFAVFIERCSNMLTMNGIQSMLTQHAWMFLNSFEKLRKKILEIDIVNMAHLGSRAFEEISGEVVQTTAFVRRKCYVKNYQGKYCRLIDFNNPKGKEEGFILETQRYSAKQSNFNRIPGVPIAYWVGEQFKNSFDKYPKLGDFVECAAGISTGDNDLYLKLWHEVEFDSIAKNVNSDDQFKNSKFSYAFCNKGGKYRKWYGNNDYVAHWKKSDEFHRNGATYKHLLFIEGLTWSEICLGSFNARYYPSGYIFDHKAPGMFAKDSRTLKTYLGLLNSKVVSYILSVINPTISTGADSLRKIPVNTSHIGNEEVLRIVEECIEISKKDWDSYENSWEFERHPLIESETLLSRSWNRWQEESEKRFKSLKENERKLNHIFISLYGMENDITPEVDENDVTVRKADLSSDIRSLVSYAVGCIFGRYSLDEKGLVFAGGAWDESRYHKFIPDCDGVIPITDTEYFKDDIVSRFEEFVRLVFGNSTYEDNLNFIAEALGNKGKTSREAIRNYFVNDFFKDHCNMYSVNGSGKRPIYWLFDSGKQNGFKCLIYIHRYTKDTLNLIRSEYLHKTEDAVESALKNAEYIIHTSSSAVEKAKASKDRDKYVKQLNEMRIYYQALSHMAIQKIEIDLDDGVKKNYQLFQNIEVIVDGGKKQKVDLLAKI